MRVLRGLKVPGLIILAVGAVWVAAWDKSTPEPTSPVVMLPPTYAMQELTAEVQQRALQEGEFVADLNDRTQ
jgi:hypothetical protein